MEQFLGGDDLRTTGGGLADQFEGSGKRMLRLNVRWTVVLNQRNANCT